MLHLLFCRPEQIKVAWGSYSFMEYYSYDQSLGIRANPKERYLPVYYRSDLKYKDYSAFQDCAYSDTITRSQSYNFGRLLHRDNKQWTFHSNTGCS